MALGKRKIVLIGLAGVCAVCMGGVIGYQAYRTRITMQQDGYVNWVNDSREYEMVSFRAGTAYKYVYPEKVSFQDQERTRYTMDKDIFVHYNDKSIGSFNDGILLDTERIQAGMVQPYYVTAGTMLTARDGKYYIENNGAEIEFEDFIWKTGEDRYLIVGEGIHLVTPDGTDVTPEGYVEVSYLEDGVVQMIADSQMWLTVASGAEVTWGDGLLDLKERMISNRDGTQNIYLEELDDSAEQVIRVASTAKDWSTVHPSWNFTVINGTDGTDGEAGETGEDGAAGEQGSQGSDGSSGAAGEDGDAGAAGERGKSSFAQLLTDAVTDTSIEMTEYEASENQIYGSLKIHMGDWELQNLRLCIKENGSGNELTSVTFEQQDGLQEISGGWILEGGTSESDDEIYELSFSYGDDLRPDTQYQLVLTADYYNDDVHMGNKVFLNRTFYTDSQGIRMREQGVTEYSVDIELGRKNESQALTLVLYDSSLHELDRIGTSLGNGTGGLSTRLTIDDLEPNTSYYVGVQNNGVEGEVLKITTLKRMPELGTFKAELGIGSYRLYFDGNEDPDHAVVGYAYEIYDENLGDHAVKTLTSTSADGMARAVFDNQILYYNTEYSAKAWVTCYDNEKYVRFPVALEDDPATTDYDEGIIKAVELEFPSFALLEAEQYELGTDHFAGWFRLQIPADTVYQVYYGGRDENPIYLMVLANAGAYKEPQIFTYTWEALLDPVSVKISYPPNGGGKVNLDVYLELDDLKPSTDYYIYLFGDYANLAMIDQDMAYASGFGMLGSCKFTTKNK